MSRRVRIALLAVAAALAAAGIALWVWLPFDPLEAPAGPLDRMLPADVDTAWRADGPALLASPFAAAVWEREDVRGLRERWDVEGRVLEPFRRFRRAVEESTRGLAEAPSIERDLAPGEVVAATRGDAVLVLSRISSRARFLELLRRLPAERLAELGLGRDEPYLVLRDGDGPAAWFTRRRDVLLASTSRALVTDAVAAADAAERSGNPRARTEIGAALAMGTPVGARVLGWARNRELVKRLRGDPPPDDPAERSWWEDLVLAPDADPPAFDVDLSRPDAAEVSIRLAWRGGLPPSLAPLTAHGAPEAPVLAPSAGRYAVAGEAIDVGGLSVHASAVLRALLASQPPERQSLLEDALASAGESIDSLSEALAARLQDGVGFVVARLREADGALGGDAPGSVHAIPATLVVFRLRGADAADGLLADLRERAETLFGAPLGDRAETLADGTRLHTLRPRGMTGEWALLRPAFAFRDGEFVFCTHEGYLRRALAGREPARIAVPAERAATLAMGADAAALHRWIDDQAWEHADRATWRDWAEVRAEIEDALPPDAPTRPAERERLLDERVRAARLRRRKVDVPREAAAYRERWAWLSDLAGAEASLVLHGSEARVRLVVRLADE